MLAIDFIYWFAFAIFQTTFALFAARRFGFDVAKTGYFFAAFGILGAIVQGGIHPADRAAPRRQADLHAGLVCGAVGLIAARSAHSVTLFALALVPLALGIGFGHPTVSSLVSRAARGEEQGRVQGAASAVESLGRTIGPVWGNASLQRFGEAMPYMSAAAFLLMTLGITIGYRVVDSDAVLRSQTSAYDRLRWPVISRSSSASVSPRWTRRGPLLAVFCSSRANPANGTGGSGSGTRPVRRQRTRSARVRRREWCSSRTPHLGHCRDTAWPGHDTHAATELQRSSLAAGRWRGAAVDLANTF